MREIGSKNISTNFEGKFGWTFDARNMVQSYADLLTFNAGNYIPNGFPVAVFDEDESKMGIYICKNQGAVDNAASWFKVGGTIDFVDIGGDPYANILLKNLLDQKQNVINQLISQVDIIYVDGDLTISALGESNIRWGYDGSIFSVASPVVIAIPPATTGFYRKDLIYASNTGTGEILRRAGTESESITVPPLLEEGEILITIVDIFGDSVTEIVPPDYTLYARKNEPNTFNDINTFKRGLKLDNIDNGGYDFYNEDIFRGSIKFDRIDGAFKLISRNDSSVTYEWVVGNRNTKNINFAGTVSGAEAIENNEFVTLGQLLANGGGINLYDPLKTYDSPDLVLYEYETGKYRAYYAKSDGLIGITPTDTLNWGILNEIVISDTPISGGTNAFSTGGAYTEQQARIQGDLDLADNIVAAIQESKDYTDSEITSYDSLIKDGVPTDGNTFLKLYNKIISGFNEQTFNNLTERDAYNVISLPFQAFVLDDGDGKWALYKATSTGVGATYIKISDPDLLNAAMTAAQIKTAYESNPDTNAFTNALLAKLNAITGTNTGNETTASIGALIFAASTKTTIVDADVMSLNDSEDSNFLKKISWANIKATLKTYFDTLYNLVNKASTSEIDAGTDDDKYVTALGLENSKYLDRDFSKITGSTSGTNTAYTMTLTPALSSLVTGQIIIFQPNITNAAGVTLNVNGTGARAIVSVSGAAIPAGVLKTTVRYPAVFNGTQWQLLSLIDTESILNQNTSGQTANYWITGAGRVGTFGAGIAAVANAFIAIAASTASVASFLLTFGASYTGTANGSVWGESTNWRLRILRNSIASDFLFSFDNFLFKGVGTRMMVANSVGDISATDIIDEMFVMDTDVISAITGGTYVSNRATITPASNKVFYQGQLYDDGTYTYLAIDDNLVRRW